MTFKINFSAYSALSIVCVLFTLLTQYHKHQNLRCQKGLGITKFIYLGAFVLGGIGTLYFFQVFAR